LGRQLVIPSFDQLVVVGDKGKKIAEVAKRLLTDLVVMDANSTAVSMVSDIGCDIVLLQK
jgi:hypothetical protein